MKERKRYTKKYWSRSDGFMSSVFLAILLYIVGFATIIMNKDSNRIKVIENMKTNMLFWNEEVEVINDIKKRLCQDDIDAIVGDKGEVSYQCEREGDRLYVHIASPYPEDIVFEIDISSKHIYSWSPSNREIID